MTIPAGALSAGTPITIASTTNPQASPLLISGTAFDLGPAATTFAQPVTLQIKYDPALVPTGTEGLLRLHKLIAGLWTVVAGSSVNTTTHVVTGATSAFGTFAVLRLPPVASVTITPAPLDLPLGMQAPLVATLKDAQGNVLTGRPVSWTSSLGNIATIDGTGLATSAAVGTTTITATSEGINGTLALNVRSDPSTRTLSVSQGNSIPGNTTCAIGIDQHGYCWGQDNVLFASGSWVTAPESHGSGRRRSR